MKSLVLAVLMLWPLTDGQLHAQTRASGAKRGVTQSTPKSNLSAAPTPAQSNQTGPSSADSTFLRATIRTSRPEVTLDGAYGIFAELENVTSVPIVLFENDTQLVIQPEVTGSGVCAWPGFRPNTRKTL